MKFINPILSGLIVMAASSAYADTLPSCAAFGYAALARTDAAFLHTDVQGWLGAGRNVKLERFGLSDQIVVNCPADRELGGLVVGGDVSLRFGSISGSASMIGSFEASNASSFCSATYIGGANYIDYTSTSIGPVYGLAAQQEQQVRTELTNAIESATQIADFVASLTADVTVTDTGTHAAVIEVPANWQATAYVVTMTAATLNSLNSLTIRGNNRHLVVIQVTGSDPVIIDEFDYALQGGITPGHVLLSMANVTNLSISHTHNATIGLGAEVLAPRARASFFEGLITGGLFASEIDAFSLTGLNGGQINGLTFVGASSLRQTVCQ